MPPCAVPASPMPPARLAPLRSVIIGIIGFLTLVDLFAAQAILPSLVRAYGVSPAAMGVAVNASTLGMAVASLGVTVISSRVDQRFGIWASLALLAIPTSLLALAPDIATFTALRVLQGIMMASAFALTMTWLGEHLGPADTQSALAAYITGVVASNLFGRLASAAIADVAGLALNFYVFAGLNLAGAALVVLNLETMATLAAPQQGTSPFAAWRLHLSNRPLRAAFAIGFLILFAFIGTFTYVNFVLTASPIALSPMSLGLVYLVFLPSMLTTPVAGRIAVRFGVRRAVWAGLLVAAAGLPLLLSSGLWPVLTGMTLVGIGTFFAQASTTGFVGRTAMTERGAASGLYLASYYLGGLAGAAVLGQVFQHANWATTVAGIVIALGLAGWLAADLTSPAKVNGVRP